MNASRLSHSPRPCSWGWVPVTPFQDRGTGGMRGDSMVHGQWSGVSQSEIAFCGSSWRVGRTIDEGR